MIAEWIVSISTLIMSVTFFVTTFSFPRLPADPAGLALFPRILCVIAAAFSFILIGQLISHSRSGKGSVFASLKTFGFNALLRGNGDESAAQLRRMSLVIVFSVFYPWFIIRTGFIIATAIYSFLLMQLFKSKALPSAALSILMAVVLYLFFARLLEAYVPEGIWLDQLMD